MSHPDQPQSGNVLFLILIAVALFAALSFAVTSSSRMTEKGGPAEEKAALNAAQVLAACSGLRQTAQRMLFQGISSAQLELNQGGDPSLPCTTGRACIFAPDGGGTFVPIPPRLKGAKGALTPEQMVYYFYNASDGEILPGVNDDNPLPMFMATNISYSFCRQLNRSLKREPEPESIVTSSPEFRDECVSDTGAFYFKCPLAPQ